MLSSVIKEKDKIILAQEIIRDEMWDKLKSKIGKGHIWYVITPANYEYCKSIFNLKMSKDEFSNILKKRINILKENDEEIQLSIHLCKVRKFLEEQLQESLFEEAMEFMKSLDVKPKRLILIDGVSNNYTMILAKKFGFEELTELNISLISPFLKITNLLKVKKSFIESIFHFFQKGEFMNMIYLILGGLMNFKENSIHAEALVRDDLWKSLKKKLLEVDLFGS